MTYPEALAHPRVKRPSWSGFELRTKDSTLVWLSPNGIRQERPFTPTLAELDAADWEAC